MKISDTAMIDKKTIRILIVDDDREDALILQRHLKNFDEYAIETDYAEDLDAAMRCLESGDFDLILLDNRLGSGVTATESLIDFQSRGVDVPVVVVTGQGDEQTAVELMKMGAYDYIVKGAINTNMLEKTVLSAVEKHILIRLRIEAERERLKINEELQSTVEKLTGANRELADFAHIIAHDLKSPLRAIVTLAEWLQMENSDELSESGEEHVHLMIERANRLSKMIDGILSYSKIGHALDTEKIDLNKMLSQVISQIGQPENIKISITDKLPIVTYNRTMIIQVFQNLLSNSIKYMDKDEGLIRIGCCEEGDFWKFSVADNGPGIDKKYYDRIFQIFQTLSPRDEIEATGIGLSITKKIVETYKGKIWVRSEPAQGSTFFFTLPKQQKELESAGLTADITY